MPRHARARGGFTLIELMITIGIIVVLISILIPTVAAVRRKAQAAVVQQQIQSIAGAIERFHQEQGRYPGLPDRWLEANSKGVQFPPMYESVAQAPPQPMTNAGQITSSESLVLELSGGLKIANGLVVFDRDLVNKGRISVNYASPNQSIPKRVPAYLEIPANQLSAGKYYDAASPPPVGAGDSNIPEILDAFPNALPIIYLRAHVGAPGVILDDQTGWGNADPSCQYFLTDLLPYTNNHGNNLSIGEGKRIRRSDYTNNATLQPTPILLPHGLASAPRTIVPQTRYSIHKNEPNYMYPYDAYAYLVNPASTTSSPTPRSQDRYILISAGVDRVYGTEDDICSFGDVQP